VFKLHPFESIKGHKNLIRRLLSSEQCSETHWISGPPTKELWDKAQFAMTVESTIALECAVRQIPVFLCAWLKNVYGDYLRQYAKLGVGHILRSSDEIRDIPRLLATWKTSESAMSKRTWQTIEPTELRNLLNGNHRSKPIMPIQVGEHHSSQF